MTKHFIICLLFLLLLAGCGSDSSSDDDSDNDTSTNSVPAASNVSISDNNGGSAVVGDTLTGNYDYSDDDGDIEGTSTFRWLRGGTPIPGATAIDYTLVPADEGQLISFEITPIAVTGETTGTPVVSPALTVSTSTNSVPVASNVSISDNNGGSAVVGDTLTGNYDYSDDDGDIEGTSTFRWLRGGTPIPGATAITYTLVPADEGQLISFEITPIAVTGELTGTPVVSPPLTVSTSTNSVPVASNVSISDNNGGSALVGDTLTGNYDYSDDDGDIEGTSTFRWLRGGTPIPGATAITYALVPADEGELISFEVTPIALTGETTGTPVVSPPLTVSTSTNSVPVASNVSISDNNGGSAVVGDTLTGNYDYSDDDGDIEGTSTFRWLRGGTPIAGATAITYALVLADEGELISFEVTPIALTGETTGTPVVSPALAVSDTNFPQPFDTNASYVNEIYADVSASVNGNGSQGLPFDNIPDAITAARNLGGGTRIHIAAGTYPAVGLHENLQGMVDAPIALVAEGDVIIDAGNSGSGMTLNNARYVVMDGFTIQNTGIHGLNISDGGDYTTPSDFVVLRNMHFRNIGSGGNNDCLKLSGVDNFYIEDSEFEGCNRGEAIDMVGCHDGVISGNYFHDVIYNAVQTKGGSSDILIHGNRFIDIPLRALMAGGNTGDPYFRPITAVNEAERITMMANLIENTGQSAIVFSGCVDCIATNNTLIEPNGYVFWAVEENTDKGPGQGNVFVNNIVIFNESDLSGYSFFNSNGLSLINTFTIDANLWFALDNPAFSTVPNGYGFPMGTNGIIQQDPLLDMNYRLTPGSPAIGQGIDIPVGITLDFDGIQYLQPPSIGAFSSP